MPCIYRPGTDIIIAQCRAIIICFRPLTAKLVETVPFAVPLVAKLLGKTTGIEMGPALTVLMNEPTIGKFRSEFVIQLRQLGSAGGRAPGGTSRGSPDSSVHPLIGVNFPSRDRQIALPQRKFPGCTL